MQAKVHDRAVIIITNETDIYEIQSSISKSKHNIDQ